MEEQVDYCSKLKFTKVLGYFRTVLPLGNFRVVIYKAHDSRYLRFMFTIHRRNESEIDLPFYSSFTTEVNSDLLNKVANFVASCKFETPKTYMNWVLDSLCKSGGDDARENRLL